MRRKTRADGGRWKRKSAEKLLGRRWNRLLEFRFFI